MKLRLRHSARWTRELAPTDRRLWLLGSIGWRVEVRRDPVWDFVIYWKRLLLSCVLLAVTGYLGTVTALHWWWGRQPEAKVRWIDIALAPVRWEQFRRTRGEVAIAAGLQQLEKGNFSGAVFNLRAGLARSPGNIPARITLARLSLGRPAEAIRQLEAGLKLYPDQPELLRMLFAVHEAGDAGSTALARCEQLLAADHRPALTPETRSFVQSTRALFLAQLGRHADALAALPAAAPAENTADNVRALRIRLKLLSRLGRHDEAARLLAEVHRHLPRDENDAGMGLDLAVEAGDEAAVQSAARRLKVMLPGQVQPLLLEYEAWHRLKRSTLAGLTEREIYEGFGSNDRAMQEFGLVLVRLELPEVLRRASLIAQARGLSVFAFDVDLSEIALRRGDFAEALRLLQRWEGSLAALDPAQRATPTLIARVVRACALGGADHAASLASHLEKFPALVTAPRCKWLVERLTAAGRYNAADAVLRLALDRYPLSDSLKEQHFRVSLVLAREKPAAAEAAAEQVTDSVPATAAAAYLLLDQEIAAANYSAVAEKLHRWRQARPEWQAEAEREINLRELHVALLTQDPWLARFAVRKHLDRFRRGDAAVRLVELAMALRVAGKAAESDIVRGEVAELRGGIPAVAGALAKLNSGDASAAAFTNAPSALALVEQALGRRDPENALWLIERVRRSAPEWLKDIELDLATREIRARLAGEQRALAYGLLRDLAVKPGAPRAAAFRLVRDFIAAGQGDTALALAKEIERLVPGELAVSVLIREAEAAPPPKP